MEFQEVPFPRLGIGSGNFSNWEKLTFQPSTIERQIERVNPRIERNLDGLRTI
jgi:hypothetical protein